MFKEVFLNASNVDDYDVIPEEVRKGIKKTKIHAVAVYDGAEERYALFGIYGTSKQDNWLCLEYFFLAAEEPTITQKADFVRYCIRRERTRWDKKLTGVWAEFYENEAREDYRDVLALAGMEVNRERDNTYEFTLGQVGYRKMLEKAENSLRCEALCDVSDYELDRLVDRMEADKRAFPFSMSMNWLDYHQDISCVCFIKKDPCGVFLVSQERDYLVVDLVWNSHQKALASLLSHALFQAEKIFDAKKRVLVPVILKKTGEIVERMVPQAVRGEVIEAVIRFD